MRSHNTPKFKLQNRTTDIAIDLDMSLHVVQCTIKLWHDIGDVVAEPKLLSHAPKLSSAQIEVSKFILMLYLRLTTFLILYDGFFLHCLNGHQIFFLMSLLKNLRCSIVLLWASQLFGGHYKGLACKGRKWVANSYIILWFSMWLPFILSQM